MIKTRGGVEDTRLEAKAQDTKKSEAKAKDSEDRHSQGQGLKTQAQVLSKRKKKGLRKNFLGDLQKKKKRSSQKFFKRSPHKNVFQKNFSSASQNFNNSKNSAVLKPRTGQFSRTWGLEAKAKDFKMCPRGQERPRGLHLW